MASARPPNTGHQYSTVAFDTSARLHIGNVYNYSIVPSKLVHSDFTVGWICSLPIELAAAQSMLDEEYQGLPQQAGDQNVYSLGRIGKHNIVITSLPLGRRGLASAAIAATWMIRTFPSVRIGLLVGIGGGAPNAGVDIRLGDVVVGSPQQDSGGVVQFDSGMTMSTGRFERTGYLNRPPALLLAAMSNLSAKHMRKEPQLQRYVTEAIAKSPGLKNNCSLPGLEHDLLFDANYEHHGHDRECISCDLQRIVPRAPRSNIGPVIHYGLIASGNQLLTDALTRDRLSQVHGAICFDMEAAGLMNDFPCVVIRGISDYSDSHRNKLWQGYAAVSAAAYAKELLFAIPESSVTSNTTVADILDLDLSTAGVLNTEVEISDLSSLGSNTLTGGVDPDVVDAAVERLAQVLVSDQRMKSLYATAILRMTPSVFNRKQVAILVLFSKALKKGASSPLERATVWLLKRRKYHVAARIYELICLSHNIAEVKGLPVDQVPLAQQEQLMRFINDKFPVEPPVSTEQDRLQADDTDEIQEEEDPEDDEYDPPDSDTLSDLKELDRILCHSTAYWEAYKELKQAFFPSPSQLIKKVLSRHIFSMTQPESLSCIIEWEFLEYIDSEGITADDIESIFTISGEFSNACAVRLGNYIREVWRTGGNLLDAIKSLVNDFSSRSKSQRRDSDFLEAEAILGIGHKTKIRLPLAASDNKEQALVQISGTFEQISETLEQLAWLAATLRPNRSGVLMVSEIDLRVQQAQAQDPLEKVFKVSLFDPTGVLQPDSCEPGQCWTSLFNESVLAYGFPGCTTIRPSEMLGLEIPFEIMTAFAGVKFPIMLGEQIVFANETNLLVPVATHGDSILWHFSNSDDRIEQALRRTKIQDPRLQTFDLQYFMKSRSFLGYCKSSGVLLGTAEFENVCISESGVPRTGPKLSLKLEGPFNLGVSGKGYATLNMGTTWKFNSGESGLITGDQLALDGRIKRAGRTPALLYDDQMCRAFLTSELSIILQMVTTYLRKDSLLKKRKIPCAEISADGGDAAYNAIKNAQNLLVPFGIGSPQKYVDIVDEFITIFQQRKLQTTFRRKEVEISLKVGLRGWDYADLQEKNYEFWERQLPTSLLKSRPIWWKLFKKYEIIVLFGRNVGCPVRSCTTDPEQASCGAWAEIPIHEHVLLASMTPLLKLKRDLCQNAHKFPRRYMLTNKLAWARPMHSRLFEQDCEQGKSCKPLQTLCKISSIKETSRDVSKWLWGDKKAFYEHPGRIEPAGAALFVDNPSAFETRPCRMARPPTRTASNIYFILVCTIFLVIAYILAIEPSKLYHKLSGYSIFEGRANRRNYLAVAG